MTSDPKPLLPPGLPVPIPTALDRPYWEAAARHQLVVQRCGSCRRFQWGPEELCHRCLSFDMTWDQVEPVGFLYSWERTWRPPHPALAEVCPFITVLVELPHADNIRMVGNLLIDGSVTPAIGARVTAVFEDHRPDVGAGLPAFTLVQWTTDD